MDSSTEGSSSIDALASLEQRISLLEDRNKRLETLLILSNLQGPDPTSAPGASHTFFRLRDELLEELGAVIRDPNQGSLLEV